MKWPAGVRSALGYRRLIKAIDRHTAATEQQNLLLLRLADAFAPALPAEPVALDTGASYADPEEIILTEQFIQKMTQEIGRAPTEAEIERMLRLEVDKKLDEEVERSLAPRRHARHPMPVTQ